MSAIEVFLRKVDQSGECWIWTAYRDRGGYGIVHVDGRPGRTLLAHRYAYELFVGPIPKGLQLDHLCRVRHCVNPAHLEPVTQRENILRGIGLAAANARKTHCKRGHEFTSENTRTGANGKRRCCACRAVERGKAAQGCRGTLVSS